jgi:hypothetical protein
MSSKQKTHTQNLGTSKRSGPKAPTGSTKNKSGNTIVKRRADDRSYKSGIGKQINTPARKERRLTSMGPKQMMLRNGGIRIEMEEFVGPIFKLVTPAITDGTGGNLLPVYRLRINPGSAKTFTWLSSTAVNYENYKFLKCEFHYINRVGTTTSGSIIMSPDYDAEDGEVPVTEKSLYSNKGTTDESVYECSTLKLLPASMHRLYKSHAIMSDDRFETTDQDSKTVDCAQVHILLDTETTLAMKFGKLIVKYIVELTEPQNPTEPSNKGGLIVKRGNNLTVSSVQPFTAAIPVKGAVGYDVSNGIASDPGVLRPLINMLPNGVTFPNATIGQFIRDYQGSMNLIQTGTGMTSFPKVFVGPLKNLNLPADIADDVEQSMDSSFQFSNAADFRSKYDIIAKAGDLLRLESGSGTTITGLQAIMGGVLNQRLEL